jgi:hypothetical protein
VGGRVPVEPEPGSLMYYCQRRALERVSRGGASNPQGQLSGQGRDAQFVQVRRDIADVGVQGITRHRDRERVRGPLVVSGFH